MIFKKINITTLFSTFFLFFIISCSNSNSTSVITKSEPPPLPSSKSVMFDFSIFDAQPNFKAHINTAKDQSNYEQAATSIRQIQDISELTVDPIAQLLVNADSSDAENIGDGKWEWNYKNEEGKINGGVRLVAIQNDDGTVKWEFYITSSLLKAEDQLLVSGTTNTDVTEGTWTYYTPARFSQAQQEFADLDWNVDENEDVSITMKVVADIVGNSFEGSQLDYYTDDAVRHFVLNDTANDKKTTIEFNADTQAGFIQINDGEKACWNANFENVACSEI